MDGDFQHFPEDIPRFTEKIDEGYDIVSAGGGQKRSFPIQKVSVENRELDDGEDVRDSVT